MKSVQFSSVAEFEEAAFHLLREHLTLSAAEPHVVMLSGGRTPIGIYRRVAESQIPVDRNLRLLLSDERHVPPESPDSNYGQLEPLVRGLDLPASQFVRVHTELPLDAAASRYDRALNSLLEPGGRITLGLLGLGADGHTASLFGDHDLASAEHRYAIPILRPSPPHRVSVTPALFSRIEKLVFLVMGPEKAAIVNEILSHPERVIAARAVQSCGDVALWYCESPPVLSSEQTDV